MAMIFGPQLIYTVIVFVVLTKLGKYYSLGRFLLHYRLFRYLSPSSDDLKKAVRNYYKSVQGKNKKLNKLFEIDDAKEEFNIPEGATVELSMAPVMPHDLYYIKYTDDFQSFVDVSLIAFIIYIVTEIYYNVFYPSAPMNEFNLSVLWCAMIISYGLLNLSSIAVNYLRTAEASLLLMFAALSFLLSMIVQLADTKFFDFNLKSAFHNVTNTTLYLMKQHLDSLSINIDPTSEVDKTASVKQQPGGTTTHKIYSHIKSYSGNELLFTCTLATLSAFIGALLFFPSFRLARLHYLCLKYSQNSKLKRFVYYVSFLLPLLISLCWIKPAWTKKGVKLNSTVGMDDDNQTDTVTMFLDYISKPNRQDSSSSGSNSTAYLYMKQAQHGILFFLQAPNLHIYLILTFVILRLVLYNYYAQAYLNLGFELASSLRRKSTRVTNLQYITTLSSIYQYYGVVASQLVLPLFILMFTMFLLKTLGEYSWCEQDWCYSVIGLFNMTGSRSQPAGIQELSVIKTLENMSGMNFTVGQSALSVIFTQHVWRSLLGYLTFWICFIWFIISACGLLYYQYFDRSIVIDSA